MARKRKPWSKTIEESGIRIRIYEREIGSVLYREARRADGSKDRISLQHRDRRLAEEQARATAQRYAELRFAGHTGRVTIGQLVGLFQLHRVPLLSEPRQRSVRGMIALLERHFARDFAVDDLSQHDIDSYIAARSSGRLIAPRHRTPDQGVGAGTIRNELQLLQAMLRWARQHRVAGRRLLAIDPLEGIRIPREQNAKRPIATVERYEKLLTVAGRAESSGRFECVLVLARETGRRINALCSLRVSDVLLSRERVERALACIGQPIASAASWPHGALLFRGETDKRGYTDVVPISLAARSALEAYLRRNPRAGDVPLFPGRQDVSKSVTKETAGYWLKRAETLASLPHLARGGFHQLRRLWASERRHLPDKDVAAGGGWRSIDVMRTSYQHADSATIFGVIDDPRQVPKYIESRSRGPKLDTGENQATP